MNKLKKQLNISNLEKRVFWGLVVTLVSFAVFYAYFVNQTILNIVERENIEEEIVMLNSKISELEFDYIALKNKIYVAQPTLPGSLPAP